MGNAVRHGFNGTAQNHTTGPGRTAGIPVQHDSGSLLKAHLSKDHSTHPHGPISQPQGSQACSCSSNMSYIGSTPTHKVHWDQGAALLVCTNTQATQCQNDHMDLRYVAWIR